MLVFCKECRIFLSEDALKEGYRKKICPLCGGEGFLPARECSRCGESFVGKGNLCKDCISELKEKLEEFLQNYSIEEQEAMLC